MAEVSKAGVERDALVCKSVQPIACCACCELKIFTALCKVLQVMQRQAPPGAHPGCTPLTYALMPS